MDIQNITRNIETLVIGGENYQIVEATFENGKFHKAAFSLYDYDMEYEVVKFSLNEKDVKELHEALSIILEKNNSTKG